MRSTKQRIEVSEDNAGISFKAADSKQLFVKIFNARDTINTDQSGYLPVTSSHGNRFIMVLYNTDGNYIDAEPTKDHTDTLLPRHSK